MKYIELFKNGFDSTIDEKIKPENWPYVEYSPSEGLRLSMILEENQSGYQMIDLGLPSGLKWADRNIGATSPEDAGLYFSWGNIDGHAVNENGNVADGYSFGLDIYNTSPGGQYTDSTLDAEHDAATANMGSDWHMPTMTETRELVENTDHYYIGEDGSIVDKSELDGSELRSICFVKKGEAFDYNDRSNFIEIPFAGYFFGSSLGVEGFCGYVWSSSVSEGEVERAHYLFFYSSDYVDCGSLSRFGGLSVRGVRA